MWSYLWLYSLDWPALTVGAIKATIYENRMHHHFWQASLPSGYAVESTWQRIICPELIDHRLVLSMSITGALARHYVQGTHHAGRSEAVLRFSGSDKMCKKWRRLRISSSIDIHYVICALEIILAEVLPLVWSDSANKRNYQLIRTWSYNFISGQLAVLINFLKLQGKHASSPNVLPNGRPVLHYSR